MVRREVRGPRRRVGAVGLRAELDILAPEFRSATRAAAAAYDRAGIRYALIGGIAAGAYSQPRATKDVDFIVGDEAFDVAGPIISFKPGIPLEAYGVPIDSIPPHVAYRDLYERALNEAVESDDGGILIARAELVAVTKLVGGRPRDITAVVEMIEAGTVNIAALKVLIRPYAELRRAFERVERELGGLDR